MVRCAFILAVLTAAGGCLGPGDTAARTARKTSFTSSADELTQLNRVETTSRFSVERADATLTWKRQPDGTWQPQEPQYERVTFSHWPSSLRELLFGKGYLDPDASRRPIDPTEIISGARIIDPGNTDDAGAVRTDSPNLGLRLFE